MIIAPEILRLSRFLFPYFETSEPSGEGRGENKTSSFKTFNPGGFGPGMPELGGCVCTRVWGFCGWVRVEVGGGVGCVGEGRGGSSPPPAAAEVSVSSSGARPPPRTPTHTHTPPPTHPRRGRACGRAAAEPCRGRSPRPRGRGAGCGWRGETEIEIASERAWSPAMVATAGVRRPRG